MHFYKLAFFRHGEHMKKIFFLTILFTSVYPEIYYSQYSQDRFLNEAVFKGKKNGVFMEIGAFDGRHFSNTLFFEKYLGWTGVCIEPVPAVFKKLQLNRSCYCLESAISDYNGIAEFCWTKKVGVLSGICENYHPKHHAFIDYELSIRNGGEKIFFNVNVTTFNDTMELYGLTKLDFVTIDTEGGEEKIVKSIDFTKYQIDVVFVENNYGFNIKDYLTTKGYTFVRKLGVDEVYIRNELYLEIEDNIKKFSRKHPRIK